IGEGRGFLVPYGDTAAMAQRLEQLAADEALRAELGRAGSKWVRERYSIPRLVSDIDLLYRSVLETAPARRRLRPQLTPRIEPTLPPQTRARIHRAPERLRILLLSQYFPPEIGATQSRMQAFPEYFAARGHKVTAIP